MTGLRSSAPLRADLAGGTLDIWPLYLLHPGARTVNVALGLRAFATYTPGGRTWQLTAPDLDARRSVPASRLRSAASVAVEGDPFALVLRVLAEFPAAPPGRIETRVDGPPGGGLGGSSALLIALYGLVARLAGVRLARRGLAERARDLEAQVLGVPTGMQDHHPAIRGGVLDIGYGTGGARVESLDVDQAGLAARMVLAYSGAPHQSGVSNWSIIKRRLDGEPGAVAAFERVAQAGAAAAAALRRGRWSDLGRAMDADWEARKALDPALAPKPLRELEAAVRAAGVAGAKCCGAASGGCMLFLLRRPSDRQRVVRSIAAAGARALPFSVARSGLRTASER